MLIWSHYFVSLCIQTSVDDIFTLHANSAYSPGYIDHSTEIIVVKIPAEIPLRLKPAHKRRKTPPMVSHFLTHYEHTTVKPAKTALHVDILEGQSLFPFLYRFTRLTLPVISVMCYLLFYTVFFS